MNQSIYPIGGSERELPVYVYGIGFNDWQFDIVRKEGYPHHQIIYCTRGEGRLVFDGKEYVISPNMCFLLPANYPHEYYTIGDLWETHWIAFNGTSADAILEKLELTKPCVYILRDLYSLENIFQKIYSTLKSDKLFGTFTSSGYTYDFLLEFHRLVYNKIESESTTNKSILMSVIDYIEEHYTEDIELSQLCALVDKTPQYLCKIFKRQLGFRPVEYITKKRIQHAKHLLVSTNQSVGEISKAVGYDDMSYFGVMFRRCEGVSPSEYRKRFA